MTNVAIYVRVSTRYQADGVSLPTQKDDLENYATYVLHCDSYTIFEDVGYSAKNTDRPDYQNMMARIRSREFSHLLVWKIDRISRNLLDFAAMYAELKKLDVTFISKNEQFDTSTAIGEAMLKIILVFAELERNMTSERVTAIMLAHASNGLWNGGHTPYGYIYHPETLNFTIDEDAAPVIREIYNLYNKLRSIKLTTDALNQAGYRNRTGQLWQSSSVTYILRNQFYTGTYRYNLRPETKGISRPIRPETEWIVIENHHPAIIDPVQWNETAAILDSNRPDLHDTSKTYRRKHTHVLAGLLTCGCCGKQMAAYPAAKPLVCGYRNTFYGCINHRKKLCPNKAISGLSASAFLLCFIANIVRAKETMAKSTTPETLQKRLLRGDPLSEVSSIEPGGLLDLYYLLRANLPGKPYKPRTLAPTLPPNITSLTNEKKRLERALSRLKDLYLYSDDAISELDYIDERKALTAQLETINAQLTPQTPDGVTLTDSEFLDKASLFVLTQKINDQRFTDFRQLVINLSPNVLKDFFNTVISDSCIQDGKIQSITFRNSLYIQFVYSA